MNHHPLSEATLEHKAPARLPGLDGLRAIAVTLVIVSHQLGMREQSTVFDQMGGLGVEIFFVLSGYLITYLLLREELRLGSISLARFYGRRILRICPPLLLYLVVMLAAKAAGLVVIPFRDILACLFFVRNFIPIGSSMATGHCWSLAIEEQFYLVWPIILIVIKQPRTRIILLTLLVCLLPGWKQFIYWFAGGAANVNGRRTDLQLIPIATGCLLGLISSAPRLQTLLDRSRLRASWVILVAIAVVCFAHLSTMHNIRIVRGFAQTISSLAIAVIINASVRGAGSVWTDALEAKPLAWMGRLSYSLYLWQQPFMAATHGSYQVWYITFTVNIIFIFCLACFSYYAIELPSLSLRKRLR